jgi:hypothetical protein
MRMHTYVQMACATFKFAEKAGWILGG